MGREVVYDEDTDRYSIWSTGVDDWMAEDLSRDEAKKYLMKEGEYSYNKYSKTGKCMICYPFVEEEGKIICVGTSLPEKYESCSEYARSRNGIAVSGQTYMMQDEQLINEMLDKAYGVSMGKEAFKKSLTRIPIG